MSYNYGNKFAQKWTLEKAVDYVNLILNHVVKNKECYSLTEALVENDGYDELLVYLSKKYNHDDVFQPIKKAKDIIKGRLVGNGVKGDTNPAMTIFVLKNNHGMEDKQTVETPNVTVLSVNPLRNAASDNDSTSED